jgi:hypothetical protein
MRARAVTTTVVATVVAAPVLALWAAYRGAPLTGEGHGGSSATTSEADVPGELDGEPYDHYANAGNERAEPEHRFRAGSRSPDVSVEVVSAATPEPSAGPGRLTVEAQPYGDTTRITLRASGGSPVTWSAWTDSPWLYVSQSSGTLNPGEPLTVYVSVDGDREPTGPWSARVGVDPSGAMVEIVGYGAPSPTTPSQDPDPDPTPTPSPSHPTPTPTDPAPTSSDPTTPTPAVPSPEGTRSPHRAGSRATAGPQRAAPDRPPSHRKL